MALVSADVFYQRAAAHAQDNGFSYLLIPKCSSDSFDLPELRIRCIT